MDRGSWGEERAAAYLMKEGYRILARNYRRKTGEIDIIALEGAVLCFIEVKTRKNIDHGFPCEAIGALKKKRIRQTALFYMTEHNMTERRSRIDAIEIVGGACGSGLRHLKNIF